MRRFLLAAVLAAGPAMSADMVLKVGDDMLRLSDSPCVNAGILAQLTEEWRGKFRKAVAVVGGKQFEACWIAEPESVYVTYSDGDESRFPIAAFTRDAGI